MRVCSRFTRRLTPHHHPHPTAASSLALTSLRILPPSRGKDGTASRPRASAGLRQEENTAFTAGACLGTTGLAGLPRVANGWTQESISMVQLGPVTMSTRRDGLAACRRGAKDSSLRCGGPVGAAGVGRRTSQPLHTRRVLECITELARFVKRDRRRGPDPGPVSPCRDLAAPAPHRPSFADERGPGSSPVNGNLSTPCQ